MKKNLISEVLMYLCVLLLGVSLIIWADKVTSLVSIILGIMAIIYALFSFVNYFKTNNRALSDNLHFFYAIIIIILGFILIFRVDFLKDLISIVIGIYILLSSIVKLSDAISLSKVTNDKLGIIVSLILMFIGIMCIAGKFIIPDAMIKFLGIMLTLYSIISIADVIALSKK